jgi:hypothetical protein
MVKKSQGQKVKATEQIDDVKQAAANLAVNHTSLCGLFK